jgi:hypothetical protein
MRFVVALCLVVACVDTGAGPQPRVDMKYARQHLLAAPPQNIVPFDVTLGGDKVVYLGNTVDRSRLAPGGTVTIKHYWKVLKPIGASWRPFALLRGPQGTADFMNLEASDMQVAYPPAKWKANDIIEDEQTFAVRPDWSSSYAFLYVGLIEVGKHGTLDRMAVAASDRTEDRAIVAAKLEIDLSRAPPKPGTIHVPRASGPITIDGFAGDQGWSNALTSPEFVTGDGGSNGDPPGKATAKITWDDQYLYFFVSIVDPDIVTPYTNHDDSLWKADVIEIFIDADGNRQGYVELQVNPRNATFDSWFAGPRGSKGDVPWNSEMITKVNLRGTAEGGDSDQGWDAEIAIPWAAVRGRDDKMAINTPPHIGDRWKLNVNRGDVTTGTKQTVSSWNRIPWTDWHALDKMLVAVFADPTGSIVPPADAPPVDNGAPPGVGSGSGVGSGAAPGGGSGVGGGSGAGSGAATTLEMPPRGNGSGARQPTSGNGNGSGARQPTSGSGSGTRQPTSGSGSGNGSSTRQPTSGNGSGTRQPTSGSGSGSGAPTMPANSSSRLSTGTGAGSQSAPAPTPRRSGTGGGAGGGSGRGPASQPSTTGSGSSR